ncbi:uncharacterized protein EV420DRAFT_1746620 [Desarmillaria tabescens]|uniref:Uncharacterized protein n=1 Tax=Armillaria tabescens TaxID=1929756 RepID=A0AA39TRA7_ARMTA|nr:uncharacterized protein EV420DRAFT_1746620 [Desarmillaria tabescens]KAK0461279.1 hypothetical protein EV420DRAFT_1746620 [Desarmillaria tabescens]
MAGDREYVDRAVQTDSAVPLPSSPASSPSSAVAISPAELSAYIDRNDAPSSPDFYPVGRRLHKPRLPFNGPSRAPTGTDRVVSLPETSPPSRVDLGGSGTRVVSLTECSKTSAPKEDSFSSECFDTSISTDTSGTHLSSENSLQHIRTRRLRYSGLPRTPSPPSSPESIMIIGNDVQVPVSFLHQKSESQPTFEENEGWLTWTNSPPRPIPALHGPLSLPYARCPSGAEGTIVEGEDMSRMIWGLGTDAALASDPRPHPSNDEERKSAYLPSNLTQSQRLKTQVPQHTVRHDSQSLPILSTLAPSKHNVSTLQSQQVNSSFVSNRHNLRTSHSNSRYERHSNFESTRASFSETLQDCSAADDRLIGLGIQWPANSAAKDTKHSYNSASSFSHINSILPQSGPRIFVESRTNPQLTSQVIIPTGPRMSAIDIAHQYRVKQLQCALPTPPNSSEPQWSPYFSANSNDILYNDYDPPMPFDRFQRPVLEVRNPDAELRRFVIERMNNPDIFIDDPPVFPVRSSRPTIHRPMYSRDSQGFFEMSPPPPGPPPNSPLPPTPSAYASKPSRNTSMPPSPTSPEFQNHFRTISRQPRSIPLARLIQRRLSAVPEEDVEGFLEPATPFSSMLRDINSHSSPTAPLRRKVDRSPSPQKAGRSGPRSDPSVLGAKQRFAPAFNSSTDHRKSRHVFRGDKENGTEETVVKKGRNKSKKFVN